MRNVGLCLCILLGNFPYHPLDGVANCLRTNDSSVLTKLTQCNVSNLKLSKNKKDFIRKKALLHRGLCESRSLASLFSYFRLRRRLSLLKAVTSAASQKRQPLTTAGSVRLRLPTKEKEQRRPEPFPLRHSIHVTTFSSATRPKFIS